MSHREQIWFVERLRHDKPEFFRSRKVIEIGSLDINGSIRSLFEGCQYTGVDVAPGRGVDLVCSGDKLDIDLGGWDVVCSCEMFEHNPLWRETWQRMLDLCRPGGLIFFSCATLGRQEHGTSRTSPADSPLTVGLGWEYYKNLAERDFREVCDFDAIFESCRFSIDHGHRDLYFYGIKR